MRHTTLSLALLLLALAGCRSGPALVSGPVPADFSAIICIEAPSSDHPDPHKGAVFVIEPNGILRTAIGPGCSLLTFPEPTAQLKQDEMQSVFNRLCEIQATLPDNPDTTDHGAGWVRIVARGNGRETRINIPLIRQGKNATFPPWDQNGLFKKLVIALATRSGLEADTPSLPETGSP